MGFASSNTDTFWLFTLVVFIISYLYATPLSEVGFIQGFNQVFALPFEILGELFTGPPVIAWIAVILNILFFRFLMENLGEGYVMIAIMAFFAVAFGVGVIGG